MFVCACSKKSRCGRLVGGSSASSSENVHGMVSRDTVTLLNVTPWTTVDKFQTIPMIRAFKPTFAPGVNTHIGCNFIR